MSDVTVKPSPVHGLGVFAAKDFRKGETILQWRPRSLSRAEYEALSPAERDYVDIEKGEILLMNPPERYVNHSCDPNLRPGVRADIAARDIKAGEELTTDYANFFISRGSFQCACGSPKCRGAITGAVESKIP